MPEPSDERIRRTRRITTRLARTAAVLLLIAAVLMAIAQQFTRALYLVAIAIIVYLVLGRRG